MHWAIRDGEPFFIQFLLRENKFDLKIKNKAGMKSPFNILIH
jgi:hypothetical protein